MIICPVCGYEKLLQPVEENPICPSCYTEFGFDDEKQTFQKLRQNWIDAGMPWKAINVEPAPDDWNPIKQLRNIGVTLKDIRAVNAVDNDDNSIHFVVEEIMRRMTSEQSMARLIASRPKLQREIISTIVSEYEREKRLSRNEIIRRLEEKGYKRSPIIVAYRQLAGYLNQARH
jgi:hypothetical protein